MLIYARDFVLFAAYLKWSKQKFVRRRLHSAVCPRPPAALACLSGFVLAQVSFAKREDKSIVLFVHIGVDTIAVCIQFDRRTF
jgi:hypothetical protein